MLVGTLLLLIRCPPLSRKPHEYTRGSAGITVSSLVVASTTQITATLTIAAGATLGSDNFAEPTQPNLA